MKNRIIRKAIALALAATAALGCIPAASAVSLSAGPGIDLTATGTSLFSDYLPEGDYEFYMDGSNNMGWNIGLASQEPGKAVMVLDPLGDHQLHETFRVVSRPIPGHPNAVSIHPLHNLSLSLNNYLAQKTSGRAVTLHNHDWSKGNDLASIFIPQHNPDGSWTFANAAAPNLVIDCSGNQRTKVGNPFVLYEKNNTSAQNVFARKVTSASSYTSYVSAGTYVLVPGCAPNSAVEVRDSSLNNGAQVAIWERAFQSNGSIIPTQTVEVTVVGQNEVVLRNGNSKKAIDVINQSKSPDVGIHQWDLPKSEETKRLSTIWKLVPAGNGGYFLINKNSGLALDVPFASAANGNALMQHALNRGSNQVYYFKSPSEVTRPAPAPAPISGPIADRLNAMMNGAYSRTYQPGTRYTGPYYTEQCKGFAKQVHQLLFGYNIGSTKAKPNNYQISISSSKTHLVGSLTSLSGKSNASVRDLFAKARPGDFIQLRRSHGGSHSMIFLSADANSVRVYEANVDGRNTIQVATYSWSQFRSSNDSVSVYSANDYRLH